MATNSREGSITRRSCKRFGAIAAGKGFVSFGDLRNAVAIQAREDLDGKKHRLIGSILFSLDLITAEQIDEVLNELFDESRSAVLS